MNKSILLVLLCIMISATHDLRAQTPSHQKYSSLEIWRYYQSLIPNTLSSKTTSTHKRLKASSVTSSDGTCHDSFLVLIPSLQGSSSLTFDYFIPEPDEFPNSNISSLRFQVPNGYTDFLKAIHYQNDYSFNHPDTIEKTMNLNNQVSSFLRIEVDSNGNSYSNINITFNYDSQNRLTSTASYGIDPMLGQWTSGISYFYAPSGDYIKVNKQSVVGSNVTNYFDSLVLNNGKLTAIYYGDQYGNFSPAHLYFYYNSNQELIRTEVYNGNDLSDKFEIYPRSGSDLPNSYKRTLYHDSDSSVHLGEYIYNSTTGFLESFTSYFIYNTSVSKRTSFITTDMDGDITEVKLYDSSFNDTLQVTKLYYQETPNAVNDLEPFPAEIQAYPVPSSQQVNITSSEEFNGFALYDASGRILQSRTFTKTRESIVDLSAYSPGIYFLEVKNDEKSKTVTLERE